MCGVSPTYVITTEEVCCEFACLCSEILSRIDRDFMMYFATKAPNTFMYLRGKIIVETPKRGPDTVCVQCLRGVYLLSYLILFKIMRSLSVVGFLY